MPDANGKRPLSVTLIAWLFILTGIGALIAHRDALRASQLYGYDLLWPCGLAVAAILAGTFMLNRANWARWLCFIWMACHLVISALHSVQETVFHALIFAVLFYFLLRPNVTAYFRG